MATLLETDPVDLLLGPDNDLVVTTDLQLSRGIPAIMQSCRIALLMFAGEWFLDLKAGIPYWESILAQKPEVAKKAAAIAFRAALLGVPGVQEVTKLEVDFAGGTRRMSITWRVRCAFGETPEDTLAPPLGGE